MKVHVQWNLKMPFVGTVGRAWPVSKSVVCRCGDSGEIQYKLRHLTLPSSVSTCLAYREVETDVLVRVRMDPLASLCFLVQYKVNIRSVSPIEQNRMLKRTHHMQKHRRTPTLVLNEFFKGEEISPRKKK